MTTTYGILSMNGTKTDTETACQISNAAVSGKYLKHDKEHLDNIGTYDSSTSHKWYIRKHPHNYLGLGICQSDTYTGANFWVYDESVSYHVSSLQQPMAEKLNIQKPLPGLYFPTKTL